MEFLVRIDTRVPPDTPRRLRDELRAAERARAMELRAAGALLRLWRVPGTRQAVGLFTAESATRLHELLVSMPMFDWQRITVEPLATHPQEADTP